MLHALTTRLELDISQGSEIAAGVDLALKHRFPAIVVHPELALAAVQARATCRGEFKILIPVDSPKGQKAAIEKFRHLPVPALQQNGFEVLLSAEKASTLFGEITAISEFVRQHFHPHTELRFVLGCFTRDEEFIRDACSWMKNIPAPALLRLDNATKIQQTIASTQAQQHFLKIIRECTGLPLKLSGNINTVKMCETCNVDRYAVNLKQAQNLIAELSRL